MGPAKPGSGSAGTTGPRVGGVRFGDLCAPCSGLPPSQAQRTRAADLSRLRCGGTRAGTSRPLARPGFLPRGGGSSRRRETLGAVLRPLAARTQQRAGFSTGLSQLSRPPHPFLRGLSDGGPPVFPSQRSQAPHPPRGRRSRLAPARFSSEREAEIGVRGLWPQSRVSLSRRGAARSEESIALAAPPARPRLPPPPSSFASPPSRCCGARRARRGRAKWAPRASAPPKTCGPGADDEFDFAQVASFILCSRGNLSSASFFLKHNTNGLVKGRVSCSAGRTRAEQPGWRSCLQGLPSGRSTSAAAQ